MNDDTYKRLMLRHAQVQTALLESILEAIAFDSENRDWSRVTGEFAEEWEPGTLHNETIEALKEMAWQEEQPNFCDHNWSGHDSPHCVKCGLIKAEKTC